MCVTHGPLSTYMVRVRTYGGRNDADLNKKTSTTGTVQKFINLLDLFLEDFKGCGCHVVCDSAYMGELLAMVARDVWLINIIGTTQINRCGADGNWVKLEKMKMKVGTYECKFFVHKTLPLCMALWADNSIVATLTNCYSPMLLPAGDGVGRRMRGEDGGRKKEATAVKIPHQTKVYVEEFGKIDRNNFQNSRFDLKGQSKCHNWSPKINKRYFNIHDGNASLYYKRACALYTPDKRRLGTKEQMADLAHYLCTCGESMRSYVPRHPTVLRDLSRVFNSGAGRRFKNTVTGITHGPAMTKVARIRTLRYKQQHRSPWR